MMKCRASSSKGDISQWIDQVHSSLCVCSFSADEIAKTVRYVV
jgi:hypothetical protein